MDERDDGPFEFPCEFPLKAIGIGGDEFEAMVVSVVRRHVPDLGEGAVSSRPSRRGRYLAVTVTFTATSRRQLDDLYRDLHRQDGVKLLL